MNRFDRQERIAGWDQERIGRACVLIAGRDWLGAFAAWALSSLGVGTVLWVGRPCRATDSLASWLLADPCPMDGCQIYDYPMAVEYGMELDWVVSGSSIQAFLSCAEDPAEQALCRAFAQDRQIPWLGARTAEGGWFSSNQLPRFPRRRQEPITAMALAAVLADATRQVLCPLDGDLWPPGGSLDWQLPKNRARLGRAVVVGVGAIGTYLATLLAVLGFEQHLVDFDQVEDSNRNRQGLFTRGDAHNRAYKSLAAKDALMRLFPGARLSAGVRRVGVNFQAALNRSQPNFALLSAVDNAQSRLLLQSLGRDLGLPVIQGGTSIHAADCYVQGVHGLLLDEQMHGALKMAAMQDERTDRRGGCAVDPSYVVPGMMAGALMAYQFIQMCALGHDLSPLHWRSGSLPQQQRSPTDGWQFDELPLEASRGHDGPP
jgi:molybdopterin/thiamine biosynthesis adenylyltransferase